MIKFLVHLVVASVVSVASLAIGKEEKLSLPDIEDLYDAIEECGAPNDIDNRFILGSSVSIRAETLRDSGKNNISYSEAHQRIVIEMYKMLKEEPDGYFCESYREISDDREIEFSQAIRTHALAAFWTVSGE